MSEKTKYRILFVCLGNICRSPLAEGIMQSYIEREGLNDTIKVDSAGILSYHQGELPDQRMRAHAAKRGYNLVSRSRPVRSDDFDNFDLILGMDDRNIDDLKDLPPLIQIEFLSLFFSLFLHIGKITSVSFFVFSVVYFGSLMHNLSQHFICWLFHACQPIAI
jgi:protein-tyrosine-phosphatase